MARKRKSPPASSKAKPAGPVRLQRLLAGAGFGSRRQCEELIEAGRVEVDGEIITKLGSVVDAETQKVKVDGQLLKKQKLVYYAVHKPTGVVTTNRDPQGRPRVVDMVPPSERVFPVGRLDRSSEGLILLTNDGELAQRLTHPKFGVRKIYRVTVAGKVENETMKRMRQGIHIAEGFVRVEGAKLLKARGRATEIEITLKEGKNREIRRILARLGHKVQQLRRIAVGPLRLGELPIGAYRELRREEVEKLWASVDAAEKAAETQTKSGASDSAGRGTKQGGKTKKFAAKKYAAKRGGPKASGSSRPSGKGSRPAGKGGAVTKRSPTKRSAAAKGKRTSTAKADFLPSVSGSQTIGSVIGGDSSSSADEKKSKRSSSVKKVSSARKKSTRKSSPRKKSSRKRGRR